MMRGVSETEIQFNSVERIIEYSDLESEPYDETNSGTVRVHTLIPERLQPYLIALC